MGGDNTAKVLRIGITIILIHLVLWRLLPIFVQQTIPFGLVEIIPTADRRINYGFILTFIFIAPIILTILGGGLQKIGLVWKKDNWQWVMVGTGLQMLVYPIVNLAQGRSRIDAAGAMGVTKPVHFIFYTLITAWIVDGFREELYYRGFIQNLIGQTLQRPYRLLIPVLFFSFAHVNINGSITDWFAGVIPHLLPGFLLGILVIASNSLVPSMIAHGAGNAIITGLTGIYIYAPGAYLAAVLIICLIGMGILLWKRVKLFMLLKTFRSEFTDWSAGNIFQGITLTVLLFAGYVLIMHFWPNVDLFSYKIIKYSW